MDLVVSIGFAGTSRCTGTRLEALNHLIATDKAGSKCTSARTVPDVGDFL